MWGHARRVNFDAQVAAWREAYGKTGWCCTGLQLIETPFAHRVLASCLYPALASSTADSEQLWLILLLYTYASSGAECTYCRWHDSSSQLGGIGKS